MTLAGELQQTHATVRSAMPEPIFLAIQQSIADLRESGLAARAAGEGDTPRLPALPDRDGISFDLATLSRAGAIVLMFYRGGWCPYCNVALRAMRASLSDIHAAGAELVAVTPETPDRIGSTADRADAAFPILHDAGNAFARSLGLVFDLPVSLRPQFARLGIELPAHNGDQSFSLPIPATYVIERGGRIAWTFLEADFTRRAEPADVLAALRSVTSGALRDRVGA